MKYKLRRELEMNHVEGRSRGTDERKNSNNSNIWTEMYRLREKYK